MANLAAVWGLDIGQCALKALRLQLTASGSVEVTHFDLIEHPKILTQPDAETDQLIQNALDKFLSRNEIGKARVALSVPGQASFARFVKLPPVEARRIPEIVKFEAVQQIPFDIEEVEWDYQTFMSTKTPEVEVGIFAMRKELVIKHLAYLRGAGIQADIVQLAPLALYNMMVYDGLTAKSGATILIDVGAENTDLVVSDGDRIWLRSIPLGGNNFTEALVKAFKLPFSKAENLKRTAATSKYARQIFVAMRPVFGDMVSEVQRSIGFYTSLHREAQMSRVLCLGNAFRLPGLQKYLEQNLQVEAVRPNSFNMLKSSPTVNAPAFAENLWSFGVAYGLGVQGLGLAPISSNLLPFSIARQRRWRTQVPWFAAGAAAMVLVAGVSCWSGITTNRRIENVTNEETRPAALVLGDAKKILDQKKTEKDQGVKEKKEIQDVDQIPGYRDVIPELEYLIQKSVPNQWRKDAINMVAEELGKKDPAQIDFRKDVWTRIGTPAFQDKFRAEFQKPLKDRKLHPIFLVDRVQMNFPPEKSNQSPSDTGGLTPGPAAVLPGMPAPAGAAGTPTGPGAGQAPAVGGDKTAKFIQVTIVGYTNAPYDLAINEVIPYVKTFLDELNERVKPLPRLGQREPWTINNSLKDRHTESDLSKVPCWAPLAVEAAPPAGAAAPAGGAAAPAPAAPPASYDIQSFKLVFEVQVLPPDVEKQPGGER